MKKLIRLLFVLVIVFSMTMMAAAAEADAPFVEATQDYSVDWVSPSIGASRELLEETFTSAVPFPDQQQYHTDTISAGLELRSALKNRTETVAIGYQIPAEKYTDEGFSAIVAEITEVAFLHNGVPNGGDYLYQHIAAWSCDIESAVPGGNGAYYDATLVFRFVMNSTADEEAVVDQQVGVLLASLNLTGTDYEKIKAIYDWICDNVYYDYQYLEQALNGNVNLSKHSAYAALVQRMTVCQGYSNLLYRLALEAGIDCRIITGTSYGQSHSWNIVKIDGQYYNLDSTWDAGGRTYANFLKCEANFPDHARDESYQTSSFLIQYPIAEADYDAHADAYEYVDGDFVFLIENGEATLTSYTGHAKEVTIPGTADGVPVAVLGVDAFLDNTTIQTVTIPASVTEIEAGWFELIIPEYVPHGAFTGCVNLTKVIIAEGSNLGIIGDCAFYGCVKLADIKLPNSLRRLELSSFEGCESLTEITLPEGVEVVGQNAFTRSGLRSIRIPASCTSFNRFIEMPMLEEFIVTEGNPQYRTHEGVLYLIYSPTEIYLIGYPLNKPSASYRVADFCTHISGDVFAGESYQPKHLKTIYIGNTNAAINPDGGISLARIRFRVIPDATNPHFTSYNNMLFTKDMKTLVQIPSDLTGTIIVPEGVECVTSYAAEWGSYSSIIFPESLTKMGAAVFWYTKSVKSVYIPASVSEVTGSSLFQDCNNLRDVYFGGTEAQWEAVFNPADMVYSPLYNAPHFNLHCRSGVTIQQLTCETNGIITVRCGDCGKYESQTATAPGHNWHVTGCAEPRVCTICGTTDGVVPGHSWNDATCTTPKTCDRCKVTEGSALGHSWHEATCTAPKTCSVCGATEGTTIPHTFDQEKIDPKYLVGEETGTSMIIYKKSCKCGEAGEETFTVRFKDVPKSAYYYDAAMWAVENGVTTGTGDGTTFEPNKDCTRGQVVTFLWRAAGEPEPSSAVNPFKDVKSTDFFYKAVLWAVENKITTGTGDGTTFKPNATCDRAQIVTFLSRAKNGTPTKAENPFKDVPAGAYYYNPVLWAVENGVTTGTGDGTTFEPGKPCTRGQVITFLWRAYTK